MADSPFRSRNVPKSVSDEIEARADGANLLKWTAQRFPWIYVQSCAGGKCSEKYNELGNDPDVGGRRGGKALSLFGNNTSLAAYDKSTKQPLPYVESMDVKAMGSLGTTRKASIKIKAFTDEQLIELQHCFFVPGMDVRVQWGWNRTCTGDAPPTVLKNPSENPAKAICRINKLRKKYANYDGFHGVVSNFSYSLNDNNTWDCELEVISAADPFSSSKVDNSKCPCTREVETDQGESIKDFGPIYATLADIHNEGSIAAARLLLTLSRRVRNTSLHAWSSWDYEGVDRTETGSDVNGSWWSGFFGESTIEYWMSFATFVDMINALSIPSIEKDKVWPFGKIDINDVLLPAPIVKLEESDSTKSLFCLSADPRVCYIDGGNFPISKIINNYMGGTAFNNAIEEDESGKPVVRLGSIMCNVSFLNGQYKQVYDGDGSLKTLIDNVLREINRVCGNPWNFVTIATETDCGDDDDKIPEGPTITVLDDKQVQRYNDPFNVPGKVDNSVLRKWSLAMKMTGEMKTQALYAGNSQKTRGSNGNDSSGCTGTAVAPFYSGNQITNQAKPKPSEASVSCNDCEDSPGHVDPPTLEDLIDDMWYSVNDQTVGAMQAFIDRKIGGERDNSSCAGVPLPFDFSFTLDGIGGFEFGQMVTSNRIPKEVRESFRWQVTKVEHSITANDWETTISTVCRPNPKGEDETPGRAS
jgi:hypothetical protein